MAYFKDKVVVVTGGSSGLGLAIARSFARQEARVVIAARGAAQLADAQAKLRGEGFEVATEQCDVTNDSSVERLFQQVASSQGGLDVLVNCAGRSMRKAVMETTPEEFLELFEINFLGAVRCVRAAAPQLLARSGHVVNVGSLAGRVGARWLGAYPASKFPLTAYSQQLRLELGPQGLHVLLVCPGPIARDAATRDYAAASAEPLPERARLPGGGVRTSAIRPERIADDIARACERRKAELVYPRMARLVFIAAQISPRLGDYLVRKLT